MNGRSNHYKTFLNGGSASPEVRYGKLKDGSKGVFIDEEHLFLTVERKGKRWRFRLIDLHGGYNPVTAWISVYDVEDLRTSKAAKALRDQLKREYGDHWSRVLEMVIGVVQDKHDEWKPEEPSEAEEGEAEAEKTSPEIRRRAKQLLHNPKLLYHVKTIYDKGVMLDRYRFVLGEEDKKLLTFLIAVSAKTSWSQSLWATGTSGFGKSNLVMVTLALMPPGYAKVRSYLTGAGLRYGLQDYKVLFICEWRQFAEQDIRLVSREDGAYTYEIAVRDPETQEWTTQVGEIPAKTIITTSAEKLPSAQMLRRCWLLSVDETPELTRLINIRKAEYRAGRVEPTTQDEAATVQYAVTLLEPAEVVVPYASLLVDLANWDRTRLDYFLDAISVIAWLHQYQRLRDGEGRIIATPADLYMALRICWTTLMESLMQLPERLKRCWMVLPDDTDREGATTKQLALQLSLSQSAVRNYLSDLINLNYAVSAEKKGSRGKQYWKVTPQTGSVTSVLSTCDTLNWKEIASLTQRALENASPRSVRNQQGDMALTHSYDPLTGDVCELVPPSDFGHFPENSEKDLSSRKKPILPQSEVSHVDRTVVTVRRERPSEERLTLGELLRELHSKWSQGPFNEFDDLIMQLRRCDRTGAERIRERWLEEGLLAYDPEGYLVWVR